ncbi:hypothetical protein L198_03391 [Cryptococcus wingfieldii CBS 7118]|uniref:Integral membrane bound transporter domain-containing protein n=1 Tax=Cryptococcus wingfieldii CBS 7118 TaxID=1295528 RepID=A0A1E3JFD3_9TREE|nr:hypothetical protein L198_03391 [Cryptococcus wingfieldii CBS 7118]ODN99547.1 hypothetical protein L198_03391 [Cryptococcus wingfieldii CBS 7118]
MRWTTRLRLLAAPTLASFLSFVLSAVKPWGGISGQWAFLVYTSMLIFFFPRGRIGPQIELTVLGIAGGTIGIAWSSGVLAVAAWCGRRYGVDSDQTRAILGVGLALLCIASGLIRSSVRRFNTFSKIMVFFPIFMLTGQQTITHMTAALFLEQFYVVIFAGILPLISTLIFAPHHTLSHQFGAQVEESLKTICTLLPLSLQHITGNENSSPTISEPSEAEYPTAKSLESQPDRARLPSSQDQLAKKLKTTISNLQTSSSSYLRTTPSVDGQLPLLPTVVKSLQRIVRNPLLGTSQSPGERIQAALNKTFPHSQPGTPRGAKARTPVPSASSSIRSQSRSEVFHRRKPRHLTSLLPPEASSSSLTLSQHPGLKERSESLVGAMVEALQAIEQELPAKFGWAVEAAKEDKAEMNPHERLAGAKACLEEQVGCVQHVLGSLLGDLGGEDKDDTSDSESDVRRSASPSKYATSPLNRSPVPATFSETVEVRSVLHNRDRYRLAFVMTTLLDLAKDIQGLATTLNEAPAYEKPLSGWMHFLRLLWLNRSDNEEDRDHQREEPNLVPDESLPHDEKKEFQDMDFVSATLHQQHSALSTTSPKHRLGRAWKLFWDQHKVVKTRILMSRFMHDVKHSRHVLFAIKLAGGICLLSVPAWMPPGYSARNWYHSSRGGWMVVSYMFVLEDTTGAILKVGFLRALGTFIGAVVGFVCVLIAGRNPYGLVVLATVCSIPISYNVLFASIPGLGTSTGITLPPILFIPYLGLSDGQSDWFLTWNRFVDIVIGVVAAVLVGTWFWPVHARVQYFRVVSRTLEGLIEYCKSNLRMSRDLVRSTLVYRVDDKRYEELEGKIKRNIQLSRTLMKIQQQEVSLLPRPIKLYSEIIDAIERLLETLNEIRILRFSVPRKETVLDVLPLRRELISTVLINLWASSHAYGSRGPLPQFLPSPRVPLSELMDVTEEHSRHLRSARHNHHHPRETQSTRSTMAEGYQAELAVLYGMAENEALGEVCNILEELVASARTLFGTQSFLQT